MCLNKILGYYGYNITNYMCFGLSEGIDFQYWFNKNNRIPFLCVTGRKLNCENTLTSVFNITTEKKIIELEDDFSSFVLSNLNNNTPIMCNVDRYYLDYISNIIGKQHFGWHVVCIIGYKIEGNKLYYGIWDIFVKKILWISSYEFEVARTSQCVPIATNYECFNFRLGSSHKELKQEDIFGAIKRNCNTVLTKENSGISAMEMFSNEIKSIALLGDEDYINILSIQLRLFKKYIKRTDTTGTLYREPYAIFLKEVYDLCGEQKINYYSNKMMIISEQWIELIKFLDNTKIDKNCILQISRKIDEIKKMEEEFFTKLYNYVKQYSL